MLLTTLARTLIGAMALTLFPAMSFGADGRGPLDLIRLPQGFHIEYYSRQVPGARSLALGEDGVVFVSTRGKGRVYALIDRDGDQKVDRVLTILDDLDTPNGIDYRDGDLYVAETRRVLRYPDIRGRLQNMPEPQVLRDDLPGEGHHGWRYMRMGPDGWLYVAVGAPCNVCLEPGYAEIRRLRPDGSGMESYAQGVRNSVGFDWHPDTGVLWFTDNGRDWMGDERPPDELNRAPRAGLHFGFPHCHGVDILDPDFGGRERCADYVPPVQSLEAHAASLGMRFYTGEQFPQTYRNQIFIAEHGSWNRSSKIGYRVMRVTLDENEEATSYEPFATGWLQGEEAWGRPADVEVMPDGSLLVSDDLAGVVYRITAD